MDLSNVMIKLILLSEEPDLSYRFLLSLTAGVADEGSDKGDDHFSPSSGKLLRKVSWKSSSIEM